MKRLLTILIIFLLMFSSTCANSETGQLPVKVDQVINVVKSIDKSKDDGAQIEVDNFTVRRMFVGESETRRTTVQIFTEDGIGAYAVTIKANDFPRGKTDETLYNVFNKIAFLFNVSELGDSGEVIPIGNGMSVVALELEATQYKALEWGAYFAIFPTDSNFDYAKYINLEFPPTQTLSNYDELNAYIKKYDFSGLMSAIEKHAEDGTLGLSEKEKQTIMELASEGMSEIEKCSSEYDEFDKTVIAHYKGVEDVSEKISMVPRCEDSNAFVTFGFIQEDWVFFEDVAIAGDNIETVWLHFNDFDVVRDVMKKGKIKESISCRLSDDQLDIIVSAENAKIRFSDRSGDKTLVRDLSREELSALHTTNRISDIYRELSNLIYHKWKK